MDIEKELKALDSERAIKIINAALRHFSNDQHTLSIAMTYPDIPRQGMPRGSEPVEIYLVAPPEESCYKDEPKEFLEVLDASANFSFCSGCGVSLCSSFRHVLCPLCGVPHFAT